MYWYFHIVCAVYCLWRIIRRYNLTSSDNVIGVSPGLDTIMVIILAPILAVVDISLTWIRLYKEAEEVRRERNDKVF